MKAFLLAAAAMIAVPAIAQDTTPAPQQTMPDSSMPAPTTDSTMPQGTMPQSTMPQGTMPQGTMPAPANPDSPTPAAPATDPSMQQGTMPTDSGSTGSGNMTAGGYMPSAPPMQGTMQPGANVVFQPAQSPSQAYPAPAPMAKYPVCKKGQYDHCMQAHSPK